MKERCKNFYCCGGWTLGTSKVTEAVEIVPCSECNVFATKLEAGKAAIDYLFPVVDDFANNAVSNFLEDDAKDDLVH